MFNKLPFSSVMVFLFFDIKLNDYKNKYMIRELNSNTNYEFASINWTNPTYALVEKAGIVYLNYHVVVSGGIGGCSYDAATLPASLVPQKKIRGSAWCANDKGVRYPGNYNIYEDGRITFTSGGDFVEAGFSACYPIK